MEWWSDVGGCEARLLSSRGGPAGAGQKPAPMSVKFAISDRRNDLLASGSYILTPLLITAYCLLTTPITLPNAAQGCVQVHPKAWLTDRPASAT